MSYFVLLSENPVADEDDYRIEVLISLRRLERLDKDEYTEEERQEAEEVIIDRTTFISMHRFYQTLVLSSDQGC